MRGGGYPSAYTLVKTEPSACRTGREQKLSEGIRISLLACRSSSKPMTRSTSGSTSEMSLRIRKSPSSFTGYTPPVQAISRSQRRTDVKLREDRHRPGDRIASPLPPASISSPLPSDPSFPPPDSPETLCKERLPPRLRCRL